MRVPHRLNKISLFILISATIAHGELTGYPTPLDLRINATLTEEPSQRDLSWITPEIRPRVEARFKEALQDREMREWGLQDC